MYWGNMCMFVQILSLTSGLSTDADNNDIGTKRHYDIGSLVKKKKKDVHVYMAQSVIADHPSAMNEVSQKYYPGTLFHCLRSIEILRHQPKLYYALGWGSTDSSDNTNERSGGVGHVGVGWMCICCYKGKH